jgi:hypothetical protein
MPPRGNFDDVIRQQQARAKDDTMYRRLKMQEQIMEPLPKNRPQVLMEPDMQEYDYPETRKYDYTKKYGPAPTPPAQPPEVVPKYKGAMNASMSDEEMAAIKSQSIDMDAEDARAAMNTPSGITKTIMDMLMYSSPLASFNTVRRSLTPPAREPITSDDYGPGGKYEGM